MKIKEKRQFKEVSREYEMDNYQCPNCEEYFGVRTSFMNKCRHTNIKIACPCCHVVLTTSDD